MSRLQELQKVFDLKHLMRCIEVRLREWEFEDQKDPQDRPSGQSKLQSGPFYRAFYRSFLAGAALCGTYQEPFMKDDPRRPAYFLADFDEDRAQSPGGPEFVPLDEIITRGETRYLSRFPVYNFKGFSKGEPAFGQLARFFLASAENRAQMEPVDQWKCQGHPQMQTHDASCPVCGSVDCYEGNQDYLSSFHDHPDPAASMVLLSDLFQVLCASQWLDPEEHYQLFWRRIDWKPITLPTESTYKEITVIPYGLFVPTEYTMYSSLDNARYGGLRDYALPFSSPYQESVPVILGESWHRSGLLYRDQGPPVQFFQYMLAKYFGVRFQDEAFDNEGIYKQFVNNLGNFSESLCGRMEGFLCAFEGTI